MYSNYLLRRIASGCIVFSMFFMPGWLLAQNLSTASSLDLAALQESINAMRSQYEARISALEKKLDSLQQKNAALEKNSMVSSSATAASSSSTSSINAGNSPAVKETHANAGNIGVGQSQSGIVKVDAVTTAENAPVRPNGPNNLAPGPVLQSGLNLPKIGAFTPEISLIIDGKYSNQSQNPDAAIQGFIPSGSENIPRGFSLGETELAFAGTVDNLFRAEARLVLSQNASGTSVNAEEVFFETLGLPAGLKFKGGKYFSSIGYLNNKHPHEWDFVDLPLAYQAFLGGQLNDTGAQLNWIAPLDDLYMRVGAEIGQGTSYPASNNYNQNKPGLFTAFMKSGGDIDFSSSWQGGLSYVRATMGDNARVSDLGYGQTFAFNGTTNIYIADLVYKWAPNGNPSRQNFKFQAEAFWNGQSGSALYASPSVVGSVCELSCQGGSFSSMQSGFYAQAIYQFMPNWRIGYRYDQLYSGNNSYGFSSNTFNGTSLQSWNPNRNAVMLDWMNSEYSLMRLQLARDTSLGPGLVNNQVFLQYIMSLGVHGAHRY